ncbi:alpha/beta fold hydrolase [Gryllotalpicola protaetiae]|uniref:Alpha/beta hydrolase n=1 Tax=Gryllotalpicola protaetiae TaxID=2419771 RepID=A0A387BMK8_9MICO|nr:alpha/beta hydrolase [Gryllotalpicola protaetiae]AYG03918.1 alpha/beta hydrolase [Gryllotalpicola protaetiae]
MSRTPRRRLALTIGIAAATATAALIPATTAFANTDHAAHHAQAPSHLAPKPTIVLVHGAWADASSFAPITSRLIADGYTVLSAPTPLRGLASDSASVAAFVNQATSGPVILVGHSYGGAVISEAALSAPTVKGLVYVDAFAPATGETIVDLAGAKPGSALAADPTSIFDFVQDPAQPAGDVDVYIKRSLFAGIFGADLPKQEAAGLAATESAISVGALNEPATGAAWKTLPSWFYIGTDDKVIPTAEQVAMAQRAHGTIVTGKADHLSMLEQPKAIASLIERAASSTTHNK